MQIIDSIFSKFGYYRKQHPADLVSSVYTTATGISQEKTYKQLVDAYRSWVYTAVDKISKTVASLPLKLYVFRNKTGEKITKNSTILNDIKNLSSWEEKQYFREKGIKKEEITEHPFLDLVNRPNGIMSRFMLWYETMTRLELYGLCAWYKVNGAFGLPAAIWPLPLTDSATIKPVVSAKLEILAWRYQDGSINETFKPEEILPFKYPHPGSPFKWFSPLIAQQYPYDIDLYLMQTQNALLQNKGIPGLTLKTDKELVKKQVQQVREEVNEQLAGATKAGKTFILHSGFGLERTPWSPQESQLDKIDEYARQKLLAGFDLSDGKVGLVKDANRANMEALDHTYIKECIRPKCMLIEEIIEAFLLPLYDSGLTCDFDLPDNSDKDLKLRERQLNLTTGYAPINEERDRDGKPPVPWGDEPWLPMGWMQPGMMGISEPQKSYYEKASGKWTPDRKRRIWEITERRRKKWEAVFTSQMTGYFKIQKDEVIARLEKYGPRIEAQYSGWSRKKVEMHIKEKGIGDDINIDPDQEIKRLSSLFAPLMNVAMENQAGDFYADIGIGFTFNVNEDRVQKYIGKRLEAFSKEVTGTTFDEIKSVLREGFTEGQPVAAIAETLRHKFESWEKYRAPLISRTEIVPSLNKTDILAAQQANVADVLVKSWLTAADDAVRDSHIEAERRYAGGIPLSQNFIVGNDSMDSPGNGSLAEENIN